MAQLDFVAVVAAVVLLMGAHGTGAQHSNGGGGGERRTGEEPVITTDDAGNLMLESGWNGRVFVGGVDVMAKLQAIEDQLAATRACAAEGKLWLGERCVSAVPGLDPWNPASTCEELRLRGFLSGEYYVGGSSPAPRVMCNMTTVPATNYGGNGLSAATAGVSCLSIKQHHPPLDNGTYWVTINGSTPFQVTCVNDGSIELEVQGSEFSSTGWIFSFDDPSNFFKCNCTAALSRLQNLTGNWYTGTIPPTTLTRECEAYFDIDYRSAGQTLTPQQVTAIASLSKDRDNRNFDVYTTSCDDDNNVAPLGHWIGVETADGSGNFTIQDCSSGDGGLTRPDPTVANGINIGCCDHAVTDTFASFPFPLHACASINTGGGVALSFSARTLRIKENP
ncbi:hypothetical protein PTSG_12846 [Salpingoeca rosetta]|uniref:Uncharacterized protein n=1 Tax=Salpingoeca rosetta (strain ATCC 50818 / BSB-021) TaxID=946362 RepID=F2UN20_SALR5|nr:uncharacterized protein PTSG_12846 [Salpingoeca rosetta]EGD78519.1 hypothetical protein PTSG_12846 [Salpingoeca rosetta]|eukprot:XP_004989468.1 hypothetical protein PTSG_12846 [Salpingoeca rosetta]